MSTAMESKLNLQTVHRQWALVTIRKLRLIHPEFSVTLYGNQFAHTFHVHECEDTAFNELQTWFKSSLKPVTCDIKLSQIAPTDQELIAEPDNYENEIWLNGEPLSARDFNTLMSIAEPDLPKGGLDFDNSRDAWMFKVFADLDSNEKETVQRAARKVGIIGNVEIVTLQPPNPQPQQPRRTKEKTELTLITGNQHRFQSNSASINALIHRDEDEWRSFLSTRARQEIVEERTSHVQNFSCLYDVENSGESRLSELLTIYDRVDILPDVNGLDWTNKHNVSIREIQDLTSLGRIRLILPYSCEHYPSVLIDAVSEVNSDAIILSRSLAAQAIIRGQKKEPLLYAPLTAKQRAMLIREISKINSKDQFLLPLKSYGHILARQNDLFMMRGATALLNVGVGAYLGDVFLNLTERDARLELQTCGASIEWALGLGVSYIPRDFGGFDETSNSQIIASYLSRTRLIPADPVANRMHSVTDGLLALSGVKPIDVANNFKSTQISRFRNIASKLMQAPAGTDIQGAIADINADVKAFESRTERLANWQLGSLMAGLAGGTLSSGLEMGVAASAGSAWMFNVLRNKLPDRVKEELGDAYNMLTGLATGSSIDAVVVSRSRKVLSKGK
jgi:hypothetical protein